MNQNIEQSGTKKHYGDPLLHQRIQQLIRESVEPEFTRFLNQLGNALWNGKISDSAAAAKLEKNYAIYRERMKQETPHSMDIPESASVSSDDRMSTVQSIEKPQIHSSRGNRAEFAVGAGVLGIIGAAFLLIAFAIFAMNFMSGLVKEICFYGIALALTAAAFWLRCKKDSGVLWIIALYGSIICLFLMIPFKEFAEFMTTGVLILGIQTAAAFVPSGSRQRAAWIFQMILVCLSILLFNGRGIALGIRGEWLAVFTVLMLILLNLLFLRAEVYKGSAAAFCITYAIGICSLPVFFLESWKLYVLLMIPLAVVTVVFTLLHKHSVCRWIPYWFFHGIVWYCLAAVQTKAFNAWGFYGWGGFVCVVLLFVAAHMLSGFKELRYSQCVITLFAFFYEMGMTAQKCGTMGNQVAMVLILTAAFLLISLRIRRWHAFYEVMITLSVVICAMKLCPWKIVLPVIAGIFTLGIFLFGMMKKQQKQSLKAYTVFNLCCLAVCYLWLAFGAPIYIYIIMLLFGITVMVFSFDEKYGLSDKNKYLWLGIYLTYMFLILYTGNAIINSILLAGTAILCVCMGFGMRQPAVRIYGLILAVLVAFKVVMADFAGVKTVYRMLAYLIVGALILVISFIYTRLEKKLTQEENEEEKEEYT